MIMLHFWKSVYFSNTHWEVAIITPRCTNWRFYYFLNPAQKTTDIIMISQLQNPIKLVYYNETNRKPTNPWRCWRSITKMITKSFIMNEQKVYTEARNPAFIYIIYIYLHVFILFICNCIYLYNIFYIYLDLFILYLSACIYVILVYMHLVILFIFIYIYIIYIHLLLWVPPIGRPECEHHRRSRERPLIGRLHRKAIEAHKGGELLHTPWKHTHLQVVWA